MIFQFILEIYVYSQKNDRKKKNLPPPSFHSFLNNFKTIKSNEALKFSDFQFVFINFF